MITGQIIYYLRNNKLHSAPIFSKMIVENAKESFAITDEQKKVFTRFGNARIVYATCHGEISDNEAFETPQALFAHLLKVGK